MNLYRTKDFYLTAYLFVEGYQIVDTELITPHTTEFTFINDESLTTKVSDYYSQSASVDPMSFGSAFRTVKSLIYSLKNSERNTSTSSKDITNNDTNNRRNTTTTI